MGDSARWVMVRCMSTVVCNLLVTVTVTEMMVQGTVSDIAFSIAEGVFFVLERSRILFHFAWRVKIKTTNFPWKI